MNKKQHFATDNHIGRAEGEPLPDEQLRQGIEDTDDKVTTRPIR